MLGGAPHHGCLGAVIDAADTFDVVVTGFEPGGETPVSRLQRVFGIGPEAAERLLARLPAPVQRGVPRIRAEYFRRALIKIGAHVEVRSADGIAVEMVPSVPPPAPRRPSDRPSHVAPPPASTPAPAVLAARVAAAPTALAVPAPVAAPLAAAHVAPAPAAVAPAAPSPYREPRLLPDDDEDLPLAASLSPESLPPVAPLSFDTGGSGLSLGGPGPATPASAPFGGFGATADTLVDSRPRSGSTPQASAPRPSADPAPSIGGVLELDTMADAIRLPSRATLTEGLKPKTSPAGDGARKGANATLLHGKAMSGPAAAAAAPLVFTDSTSASNGDGAAAPAPFRPPALELGLDGADMMSKLPSSIWDAPPQAGDAAPGQVRTGDAKLDLPPASATPQLDLSGFPSGTIDDPLDLPSMPAPGKAGRAPLQRSPQAPRDREQPARERPRREREAPGPRARVGRVGAAPVSKKEAAEPEREAVPFWQSAPQAASIAFGGTGGAWLGLIVLWALAAAIVSAAASLVLVLGVLVAFVAFTTLLALAFDYFRACFWLADEGGAALERSPSLSPARLLHNYLKSGTHLMVFTLAAGLPLIFVTIAGVADGATPLELLGEPATWALGAIPAVLWPGAAAMTALHNRYEAIWQLPRALGLALRAPAEYLAVVMTGALIFGAGVWLLLALASTAGVSGVLLSAVLGPPMALSHGIQGALMGYLMRARPELFR